MHSECCFALDSKSFKSILIGDSLIAGLHPYCKIWSNFFKPIDALNCSIWGDKVQNVLLHVQYLPIYSSLKNAVILYVTNNWHQNFAVDIADGIIENGQCFKKPTSSQCVYLRVTPLWQLYLYKTSLHRRKQQNIKSKMTTKQVHLYWPRQLSASTKWLPKFWHVLPWHIVKNGKLVLAKFFFRSMEHSRKIITWNMFKTSYKLGTAFQLNNADFPVLSSQSACNTVSVKSSLNLRVLMFAQNARILTGRKNVWLWTCD